MCLAYSHRVTFRLYPIAPDIGAAPQQQSPASDLPDRRILYSEVCREAKDLEIRNAARTFLLGCMGDHRRHRRHHQGGVHPELQADDRWPPNIGDRLDPHS